MQKFDLYTKKAKEERTQTVSIIDFIPVGRENAISRKMLTEKCVAAGLIDKNTSDKDRAMRRIVEKARIDYTILNVSDGNGYYRVSIEDLVKYWVLNNPHSHADKFEIISNNNGKQEKVR